MIKNKQLLFSHISDDAYVWIPRLWGALGSEQALSLVWELDTFAEGAWDKLTKTEETFNFKLPSQFYLYLLKILPVQFTYVRKNTG